MNFLEQLTRIFKYPDLRNKILATLGLLLIFRLVSHAPIPGVDTTALQQVFSQNQFLGLLDLFSGGAINRFSIAMMGVAPFINASIIMQLMTMAIPAVEALQKEGDYGRRKIAQYTRLLSIPFGIIQSYGMITLLQNSSDVQIFADMSPWRLLAIIAITTAGSVFVMWLGELISEFGLGNGISMIIMVGILAGLPQALTGALVLVDATQIIAMIAFALIALATVYFVIYITEGQRNIPISYAGRGGSNRLYGTHNNNLPLRVNQAGVIPIIFALSLLLFPGLLASFFANARTQWIANLALDINALFANQTFYGVLYFLLVVFFTYFYTWVIFRPEQVAENIQKSGGFIPGIRPGKQTIDFLAFVTNRITLAGAIFLGLIAVLPFVVQGATGITTLTIGGTGLLIVVSVALELMRQIKSQLTMKQYDTV